MKLDMPVLPGDAPLELRLWMERVVYLINQGLYTPKRFTTAPTVSEMADGELAFGVATGAGSAHEIFIKINSTTIARWIHDSTIT